MAAPYTPKQIASFAAGCFLLGYNFSTVVSVVQSLGNSICEVASGLLFPEDEVIPSKSKFRFIVGVGVIVRNKQGQILVGKRLNSLGEGLYAVPGGRVDPGETFFDAAIRELKEETSIELPFHYEKNAYIHPPSCEESFQQFSNNIQQEFDLATDNNKIPITKSFEEESAQHLPQYPPAFLCPHSIEVLCPEEQCQLIVRYVIVDLPNGQEALLLEKDKCESWCWVDYEDCRKLAIYNQQIAHGHHYKELSPFLKSALLKDDDDHSQHQPKYSTSINSNKLTSPVDVQKLFSPQRPEFSPSCPFQLDRDHLFAPMQRLAITSFNPITAQPSEYL